MFVAEYDIEEAIGYCKLLHDKRAAYTCATGVFMEEMLVKGKIDEGSFYPCDTHPEFPAACFRYTFANWERQPFNYRLAATQCLALHDPNQQRGCLHAVGFASFRIIYNRPELLPAVCSFGTKIDKLMCIEGAAGKLNTHYPAKQKEACEFLTDAKLKDACKHAQNLGANKDPKLYYNVQSDQSLFSWILSLMKK